MGYCFSVWHDDFLLQAFDVTSYNSHFRLQTIVVYPVNRCSTASELSRRNPTYSCVLDIVSIVLQQGQEMLLFPRV